MEAREACVPFQYTFERTKTARSDDNPVDARPDHNPNNIRMTFEFRVLKCLNSGNGNIQVIQEEFYEKKDWICSEFMSNKAFQSIFDRLKLSGLCSNCSERVLKTTLAEAALAERNSKMSSSQHEQELLTLFIYKFVSYEDVIDVSTNKQVPATKKSIEALKKVKVKDGVSGSVETCVICHEKLWQEATMEVTSLPCSHLFHGNCIVKWLNRSHLCPLCRYKMPTLSSTTV